MLFVLAIMLLVQQTCAHVEMVSPFPLRSPRDPAVLESYKDYNLASPLRPDGSTLYCKQYQYNDTNPQADNIKAVYEAGKTYSISLQGSPTHGGGSCQISLSYDNGQSFKVIKSIIGGCPLTPSYNFVIPTYAPSSDTVLLSWSWFNLIGNREMYQNCARVRINNSGYQRYRRGRRTYATKRQTSIQELPDMFVCNVDNGCRTVEKRQIVFPEPGSDVVYGQNGVAVDPGPGILIDGAPQGSATSSAMPIATASSIPQTPMTTASFTTVTVPRANSTVTSAGSTPSQPATSVTATPPFSLLNSTSISQQGPSGSGFYISTASMSDATSTVIYTTIATVSSPTTIMAPTSQPRSQPVSARTVFSSSSSSSSLFTFSPLLAVSSTTPTSSATSSPPSLSALSSSPSPNPLPLPCTPGVFACNTPTTFSRCVTTASGDTAYIFYRSNAPGTVCQNGQFVRENTDPCTPDGEMFCNGENMFFLCDQGGLINMGPTAPGTVCRGGVIVAA